MMSESKAGSVFVVGGAGSGLLAAISQTDIALWASAIMTLVGAVLWIQDKWAKNQIATNSMRREADFRLQAQEREIILKESREMINDLKAELRQSRGELLDAKIGLARCQALLNQVNSPALSVTPQMVPSAPIESKSPSSPSG